MSKIKNRCIICGVKLVIEKGRKSVIGNDITVCSDCKNKAMQLMVTRVQKYK